jgi:hypothetical protein
MLKELFEGNHLTFTDSVKVTEAYVAVKKVAGDLERLLATNDVERIRRNAPRRIAQINNGPKYRNSYESSIPSDKVWENGTSETLKDILKTIGSNQNHLLIIEETSINKLNDKLKHLIFSEEKRIPLFLPPSNFRGYVSIFGSATILVVQSYHVFVGLGDHCLGSKKARIESSANYTAVAYALYQARIISYDTYDQLRRRMMSFAIEIEGLYGTPTLPDGSVPKACQNVTGLGHCVNSIRAGVRELGNLLSSTPGMYGNDEYKPIGMPDIYVGAIMKLLGRRRFDKLVSILLPGLQPEREMGVLLEQMQRQGSLVLYRRHNCGRLPPRKLKRYCGTYLHIATEFLDETATAQIMVVSATLCDGVLAHSICC